MVGSVFLFSSVVATVVSIHCFPFTNRVFFLSSPLCYYCCFLFTLYLLTELSQRLQSTMANSMARSFLQAVATEEVASPLRVVQIEGLAILKIIKHCKEFSPALVIGHNTHFNMHLLTVERGSNLLQNICTYKVCEEDNEIEADGANYQLEMMRCLREGEELRKQIGAAAACIECSSKTEQNVKAVNLIAFRAENKVTLVRR